MFFFPSVLGESCRCTVCGVQCSSDVNKEILWHHRWGHTTVCVRVCVSAYMWVCGRLHVSNVNSLVEGWALSVQLVHSFVFCLCKAFSLCSGEKVCVCVHAWFLCHPCVCVSLSTLSTVSHLLTVAARSDISSTLYPFGKHSTVRCHLFIRYWVPSDCGWRLGDDLQPGFPGSRPPV